MSPENRLFLPNIIFIFIFCFSIRKTTKYRDSVEKLFSKSYWLDSSSIVDFKLLVINSFLKTIIVFNWIDLTPKTTIIIIRFLREILPEIDPLPSTGALIIFTLSTFIIDDFSRFFTHYLFHKIPFLWKLHRVHHSATVLTPITLHRSHPIESVIMFLRNILTYSLSTAFFIYLYRSNITAYEILGVNAIGMIFNFSLSNLRHSNIEISFGFIENIFISPKQHQVHHSNKPIHFNKNFGICLSIWDKLFGSLILSKDEEIDSYGL